MVLTDPPDPVQKATVLIHPPVWYAAVRMEGSPPTPDTPTLVGGALAFYVVLALVAVGVINLQGLSLLQHAVGDGSTTLRDTVAGAAAGLAVVLITRLAWDWPPLVRLNRELREALGSPGPAAVAALAIMSSVGEELLFRGALQPLLGFWITAIGFGLLHGGTGPRFRLWVGFAFLAGLMLGGLTLWTGNLVAATMCHLTVNYFNLNALVNRPIPADVT